jgi:hypothetical protein
MPGVPGAWAVGPHTVINRVGVGLFPLYAAARAPLRASSATLTACSTWLTK